MNNAYTTPKENQGFALITVLVISFLGSLIVFDTIQENLNQERMAGNYSKELNARLQAENGLAKAYNVLNSTSVPLITDMVDEVNKFQSDSGPHYYKINASLDGDLRKITSSGFHYDGTYAMHGSISLASGNGNNVFNNAITTCDGATLGGAGKIDSYDGEYDANNAGNEGDVTILNEDASGLDLTGGTEISGDVSINGDLSISNGYVYGDAQVSGNVTVANSGSASVAGSIQATGDVSYTYTGNSYITESISSNGDVSIGYSSFTGDITYGGDDGGTLTSSKDISTFSSATVMTNDHVDDVGTQECDVLDIASEFANTTDGIGKLANTTPTNVKFGYPLSEYVINDTGLTAFDDTYNVKDWVDIETQQETIDFLGEQTNVHVLDVDSFGDASLTFTVESGSNITIYLSGNDTTDISGKIKVEDGASLNIITNDKINIGSNGLITNVIDTDGDGVYETETTAAVNSNGNISTTIYSGYESQNSQDNGIKAAGGSASSFSAYAPNATIQLSGGGDLYGALRSNYLNVTGGAGIHFDENLEDVNLGGGGSGTTTAAINRWF